MKINFKCLIFLLPFSSQLFASDTIHENYTCYYEARPLPYSDATPREDLMKVSIELEPNTLKAQVRYYNPVRGYDEPQTNTAVSIESGMMDITVFGNNDESYVEHSIDLENFSYRLFAKTFIPNRLDTQQTFLGRCAGNIDEALIKENSHSTHNH